MDFKNLLNKETTKDTIISFLVETDVSMELYFKTENLLFDNFISFGIVTQIFQKKKTKT